MAQSYWPTKYATAASMAATASSPRIEGLRAVLCGAAFSRIRKPTKTMGIVASAVTQKMDRQPQASNSMPPNTGDRPKPAIPAADQILIAAANLLGGV